MVEDGTSATTTANVTARHERVNLHDAKACRADRVSRAMRHAIFMARAEALQHDKRPIDVRLAELAKLDPAEAFTHLRICDPAMGSGHFLVSLVDYLAVETLSVMAAAADAVTWAVSRSPLAVHIEALRDHLQRGSASWFAGAGIASR